MDTSPSFLNGTPTKLEELCRMCASPCVKSVQIFGPEGVANELAAKFSSHLPVKVSEADTLPLQLCFECTNLLIQWDAAVLVATAADKKLKALQWRQQQSQTTFEKTEETSLKTGPGKQRKISAATPMESITCSICNKSGMEFRELVEHLQSHKVSNESRKNLNDGDADVSVRRKRKTSHSQLLRDEDSSSELEKSQSRQPTRRKLRSTKKTDTESGSPSSDGNPAGIRGRLRGRRSFGASKQNKKNVSNCTEGGSGDPIVTSSTNSRASEQSDIEGASKLSAASGEEPKQRETKKGSPSNLTFKPKVRIISAESINQSLEERAKANRSVNVEQGSNGILAPTLGPSLVSSLLKPRMPFVQTPTKIVMSGGMMKNIKADTRTGMRFLKLPDGRIVRLIQSPRSSTPTFTSAPVQKAVPQTVLTKLVSNKSPTVLTKLVSDSPSRTDEPSEKEVCIESSTNTFRTSQDCRTSPPKGSNNSVNHGEDATLSPQRESVTLSNSRIISFNLQPGPLSSVNKYTCGFCGKRNLYQDLLHIHAQTHCPKETESNNHTVTSPSQ